MDFFLLVFSLEEASKEHHLEPSNKERRLGKGAKRCGDAAHYCHLIVCTGFLELYPVIVPVMKRAHSSFNPPNTKHPLYSAGTGAASKDLFYLIRVVHCTAS
jgi:hypothetical protein